MQFGASVTALLRLAAVVAPRSRGVLGDVAQLGTNGEVNIPVRKDVGGRVVVKKRERATSLTQGKSVAEVAQIADLLARDKAAVAENKVVLDFAEFGLDQKVYYVGEGKEQEFMDKLNKLNKESMDKLGEDLYEFVMIDEIKTRADTVPNDPSLSSAWQHDAIDSRRAWDLHTGGPTKTVAICDTGLFPNHPDLQGNRVAEGYDARSQTLESEGADVSPVDGDNHGTAVAGSAAAIGNNNEGAVGVGWDLRHRPIVVTKPGSGGEAYTTVLEHCAMWACDQGDIANLSFSGPDHQMMRDAATYCKSKGSLMFHSAGNDGRDITGYDTDADDLIVVGSTDNNDDRSSFSAHGSYVDLFAPGRAVYTATSSTGYGFVSGTSFSSPIAAGLAALIWSANPLLTPDQVELVLKDSATDLGDDDFDNEFSHGRISAYEALMHPLVGLVASSNPTGSPTANPTSNPSGSPTAAPTTGSPTANPSKSPTSSPSGSPTSNPTTAPTTGSPTANPSNSPTSSPSGSPTSNPTAAPTTDSPTANPSNSPTSSPSGSPTSNPTAAPTTDSPTANPSNLPTSSPSGSPTSNPTAAPTTDSPTANPSKLPTSNPSGSPTSNPTAAPTTGSPTANPSNSPTSTPSGSPTSNPTAAPTTGSPTANPSNSPTSNPSGSPTSNPTAAPTTGPPTANPSNSPTSGPSGSPTSNPTAAPTTGSPTGSPSNSPTSSPSGSPTSNPTAAPTTGSPTGSPTTSMPSSSPTANPTTAPTTPFPTDSPTTPAPTPGPTTESPTTVAFSNTPSVEVVLPGVVALSNVDFSDVTPTQRGQIIDKLEGTIEREGCPSSADVKSCEATVTSVGGVPRNGGRLRRLQSSALLIEYELVIEAICESSDCSDAQTLANQVFEEVTGDLLEAITDGTVVSSLQEISTSLETLLEDATATGEFSEVVVPFLALLVKWYPDWRRQSGTCKNDGNAPTYMKVFGIYFEPSLDACCKRYFGWDLSVCNGSSGPVPSGFFPNWGGTEQKCINSTESPNILPNYMRQNSEQWLNDDVGTCCEKHFNWVYGDCIRLSGGNSSEVATNKWYVNHQDEVCQRDCPEGNGGSCGGVADPWNALYETVANCCAQKLSWIAPETCEAQSSGAALTGTSEWFIDWVLEKCVKDCVDSSDVNCGGLAMRWDERHKTANECCSRLWFIERDQCTLE